LEWFQDIGKSLADVWKPFPDVLTSLEDVLKSLEDVLESLEDIFQSFPEMGERHPDIIKSLTEIQKRLTKSHKLPEEGENRGFQSKCLKISHSAGWPESARNGSRTLLQLPSRERATHDVSLGRFHLTLS
jgi:hypothetical protein